MRRARSIFMEVSMNNTIKLELISYLKARYNYLDQRIYEYECAYDITPSWVKAQKDHYLQEQRSISSYVKELEKLDG